MRHGWIGVALATALLGALTWRPALRGLGTYLTVDDPLRRVDAAVVLSGDVDRKRLDAAVPLLRSGIAGWVIVLEETPRDLPKEASTIRQHAELGGVDLGQVLIARNTHSTADDAMLAAEVMRQRGWRTAIIVTSPYHTRRAQWIFHRIWEPLGLTSSVHPSQVSESDPGQWWANDRGRRAVVLEYVKLAVYMLRY